ncbi:unnamed protein product [Boreogadus saida]
MRGRQIDIPDLPYHKGHRQWETRENNSHRETTEERGAESQTDPLPGRESDGRPENRAARPETAHTPPLARDHETVMYRQFR